MRWLIPFLALCGSGLAQEQLLRTVSDTPTNSFVEVTALFSTPAPLGYLPVRVHIENRRPNDQSLSLSFTSATGYYKGPRLNSSFSFEAPAGKPVQHDILVPLSTLIGEAYRNDARVTVELSGGMGDGGGSLGMEYNPSQPAVLMSEALYTPNASTLDAEVTKRYSSHRGSARFAGKFDPRLLPDDWRAYSGYDAILITSDDWTATDPGARSAITAWLRLGGHLILYSEGGNSAALNLPTDTSYGLITVTTLSPGNKLDPSGTVSLATKGSNPPQALSLVDDYTSHWPLQNAFGAKGFNYWVFIIVLIAFGVLVGPVNLFVFAKSGQRHRLFITTPLISLGASLILITLILLQDGFGGRGMRLVLMEVRPDNNENAAYVHQEQFSRTGVLTGDRFTLEDAVAMSPVPIDENNRWARLTTSNGGDGSVYTGNFVDGKLVTSGDWFQSRSEQGHLLTAVVPTRGRIENTSPGGTPQLLSTFDFPIESLFYLDSSGQWWKCGPMQAGNRTAPVSVPASEITQALKDEALRFGDRHRQMLQRAATRRGCYVAITGSAPGIDNYNKIEWQDTHTVITGPVVTP